MASWRSKLLRNPEGGGSAPVKGETEIENLCVNTIRTLSMDAVQKANAGHPGTPMGLAPVGYTVWNDYLRFDPDAPAWANRDRFVLSVGHASMLLYALLYLAGVEQVDADGNKTGRKAVTLDDLKQFRQLSSITPGHPEYRLTTGVECTTGPLGQGCGNSVGMAIAEKWMAAHFNKPGFPIVDHRIYTLCGDGDMMEGVSGEAASLAGHLRLNNLVWIYDSNRISIEGSTQLAFTEDTGARMLAYGWNVIRLRSPNDLGPVRMALDSIPYEKGRPTFIIVESHIGYGAPKKQDTAAAHGEPLGEDEIKGAKRAYGWPEDAQFLVPDGVLDHFKNGVGKRGAAAHAAWKDLFARYKKDYPELAKQFETMDAHQLPQDWETALTPFPADAKGLASRDSSGKVLNALAAKIPWLLGGAADLAPSTKTNLKAEGETSFSAFDYSGRNFHFGVREHAMGSIVNGMVLSGLRAYGSGFLIFSDYMRNPIRLSALSELPALWIFTHDSIGVGEDGPTHQPIEQLASLRAMPGMLTIRPGDANEAVEAWRIVLKKKHKPACLILSRQNLPTLDRTQFASAEGVHHGAYTLTKGNDTPDVILIGTGSELGLCLQAAELLEKDGIKARVVSMPCWELFDEQDQAYRDSVFPPDVKARVAVEAGAALGWERYAGSEGAIIAMRTFGASGALKDLLTHYGFTKEKIAEAAKAQIAKHQ